MKFRIRHLLILTFIAALVVIFVQPEPRKFRHKTVEDAVKSVQYHDWQHLETIGDQQGPFSRLQTFHCGRNAPGWSFTYMSNGAQKKYVIPSEYAGQNVKVDFFRNRKGNSLCLVFGEE